MAYSGERAVVYRDVRIGRQQCRGRIPDHSHRSASLIRPTARPTERLPSDIYHIVSQKQLEPAADAIKPSQGDTLKIDPSVDRTAQKTGGGCC
jgi:hypothetical protein